MDIFALEWQRVGSTSAEDVGPMARPKKLRAIDVRTRGVSARYPRKCGWSARILRLYSHYKSATRIVIRVFMVYELAVAKFLMMILNWD